MAFAGVDGQSHRHDGGRTSRTVCDMRARARGAFRARQRVFALDLSQRDARFNKYPRLPMLAAPAMSSSTRGARADDAHARSTPTASGSRCSSKAKGRSCCCCTAFRRARIPGAISYPRWRTRDIARSRRTSADMPAAIGPRRSRPTTSRRWFRMPSGVLDAVGEERAVVDRSRLGRAGRVAHGVDASGARARGGRYERAARRSPARIAAAAHAGAVQRRVPLHPVLPGAGRGRSRARARRPQVAAHVLLLGVRRCTAARRVRAASQERASCSTRCATARRCRHG